MSRYRAFVAHDWEMEARRLRTLEEAARKFEFQDAAGMSDEYEAALCNLLRVIRSLPKEPLK